MDWVTVVSSILALAGAAMLVAAVRQYIRTRTFIGRSAIASGTVIALIENRERDEVSYFPRVRFQTPSGAEITFESAMGSSSHARSIGDPIAVRYQTDEPGVAEIDAFMPLWGLTVLFTVLGVVFLFVGVGILSGVLAV